MSSIQRRALLGALASASTLAGCVSTPNATDPSSSTDSPSETDSPTATDRVRIEVENQGAAETTLDLRLSDDERTLLDRQVTVPGNERATVDTGITEPGEYELDAFVGGGPDLAATFTVSVEAYDLQQWSNVLLLVDGEHIDMWMEE